VVKDQDYQNEGLTHFPKDWGLHNTTSFSPLIGQYIKGCQSTALTNNKKSQSFSMGWLPDKINYKTYSRHN
jgi:hypothetical protein